jgi:hypothetical protein
MSKEAQIFEDVYPGRRFEGSIRNRRLIILVYISRCPLALGSSDSSQPLTTPLYVFPYLYFNTRSSSHSSCISPGLRACKDAQLGPSGIYLVDKGFLHGHPDRSSTYQSTQIEWKDRSGAQTDISQTLSFEKASRQVSIDSATYYKHALQRVWGVKPSKEQMHGTIRQPLQAASYSPIMLQRWQSERGRDQPYDNIGWVYSVSTPGQKQENGKQSEKPE